MVASQQTEATLGNLDRALAAAGRSRDGFEIVITPQQETPDSIRAFEDLGVDRLVVQLGSHKADAIDWRLPELESLMESGCLSPQNSYHCRETRTP